MGGQQQKAEVERGGSWDGTISRTGSNRRSFCGADWVETAAAGSFEVQGTLAW